MRTLIQMAGVVQLVIASANVVLPRKLQYAENIARMTPIVRQVFIVHSVYIAGLLVGLGAMCLAFAGELPGGSALGRSLSVFLALFWGARVFIQLFYYDAGIKRQNRTAHMGFLAAFIYLATVFAWAAAGGMR